MDVTISQFILEEFDVNCSLLDLQETVLESFSISFLGFHGRKHYLAQGSEKLDDWVCFVMQCVAFVCFLSCSFLPFCLFFSL